MRSTGVESMILATLFLFAVIQFEKIHASAKLGSLLHDLRKLTSHTPFHNRSSVEHVCHDLQTCHHG